MFILLLCDTLHSAGGVAFSNNVVASPTSLTFSWILFGNLRAISAYNISYSSTNTRCFTDSKNNTGITASQTTLNDLQEGTKYSITVTVLLSEVGFGTDTIRAITTATGQYTL